MKQTRSQFKKMFKILFVPLRELFSHKEEKPRINPTSETKTREGLVRWLEEGYTTLQKQTEYWAEILVVDFTKAIITFDLAMLAFIGAAVNIGANSASGIIRNLFAMYVAVSFDVVSILLLTFFFWSTVRKNINSSADRVRVIRDTLIQCDQENNYWFNNYQQKINNLYEDTRNHEFFWFPLQRIGFYLFLGSVVTSLFSVLL